MPLSLPHCTFIRCCHLETRAKKEYALTEKDLQPIPKTSVNIFETLGNMHLRSLPRVVAAARLRHAGAASALASVLGKRKERKAEREKDAPTYQERHAARTAQQDALQGWVEEHTLLKQILAAQGGYLNNKKRRALRAKACLDWVQGNYEGNVAAACAGPEVQGAGPIARSVAGMLRGVMRAHSGAGPSHDMDIDDLEFDDAGPGE